MKIVHRFLFFIIFVGVVVTAGCSSDTPSEPSRPKTPDFILTDLDGNEFQLSKHQGEVILLDFFHTT